MGQEIRRCACLPFLEAILLHQEEPQSGPDKSLQHRWRNRQILGEVARQRPALQRNSQEIIKGKHAQPIPRTFPPSEGVPQRHKRQHRQFGLA